MSLPEPVDEARKKPKRVSMAYTCSVDAFRRNAKRLEKEGYPSSLAYAQAYQALSFACERTKREAGVVLMAPANESLTLDELTLIAKGLTESLLS